MQRNLVIPNEDSRFRILTEISQQITSILDINELLVKVVRLIQRTFNYYHVGIGLVEDDEVVYRVGSGDLWDDPGFQFKPRRLKIGSEGITGWVAMTGEPALVPDVSLDLHYVWMQGSLTRSELTVPITVKGKVVGILDVQSQNKGDFEQKDLELMQAIANQTGVAIENARLYEQARHLAILDERQRLGRELHDSVTQSLYGISLYAQAAAGKISSNQIDQARQYLEDIQNTAQESLADMRLLIYELRPPILDREGLISALQSRLISVEDRAGIKSSIKNNLTNRLSPDIEEGLYQIAREALNNTIKHAHAKNVLINIQQGPSIISMQISDDGTGFDPETAIREGCLGLSAIQERARSQGWQFHIESSPGNGTRITVEIGLS